MGGTERIVIKPWFIVSGACFALAAFLRFALVGYGTLALCFAALGVVILLYRLLSKALKRALTALLILGAAVFAAALVPVIRAAGGDADVDADYLIVLGAGVNGSTPSLSMTDRLQAARAYLEAHPDCTAIVSGGQGEGEDISEAEAMYRWLTENGIDGARVILENRATSTLENLKYSFDLIPDPEAAVAVVSAEYHLYRTKLLASALGRTVTGVPAPTSLPVLKLNYFIREALGVLYYRVFGIA